MRRETVAANLKQLQASYGMPMLTDPQDRLPSTLEACRADVGAQMRDRERADLLLRALRRRAFSDGQLLDELETIHGAGREVGIASETLDAWLADEEVESMLREDMAAARAPLPAALALAHRLSKSDGGLRHSTASAVFQRAERRVVMPGFQPFPVYEVAVANAAPDLERRPPPRTVEEVLAWTRSPLATAEVAELRAVGLDEARADLQAAGAHLTPAAGEGCWSAQ